MSRLRRPVGPLSLRRTNRWGQLDNRDDVRAISDFIRPLCPAPPRPTAPVYLRGSIIIRRRSASIDDIRSQWQRRPLYCLSYDGDCLDCEFGSRLPFRYGSCICLKKSKIKYLDDMKVLLVCTENADRSQMAEGFFNSMIEKHQAFSADTKPAKGVNPHHRGSYERSWN